MNQTVNQSRELLILQIARVCHEANRSWCFANGDDSIPAWEDAPIWMVDSIVAGVCFHLANPTAGDSASHDAWMKHRAADGWTWGPNKDPVLKQHPCMVPFNQLPWVQQKKDAIFRSIVHAFGLPPELPHDLSSENP